MELGLYTFADIAPADASSGAAGEKRMRELLREIELADQVGLDIFGLGEHHRPDYISSAPAVILAAAAARTKTIRLTSAVTVLSSEDPVRVFQQYATLDLISNGRAEIMAGRGSFIESFPLFGYDLNDYDTLFTEKLQLLMRLRQGETISWPGGRHTPPIDNRGIYPRPVQEQLPLWIAVGGTPQSVVRAATLGLPLALAIIGGEPARFAPFFDLYRQSALNAGHDPRTLPTSLNVHGFVGETSEQAADDFYLPQAEVMNRIGGERGWGPTSRAQFDQSRGPHGALFVGDPETVVDKIVAMHDIFQNDRFMLQMAIGTISHDKLMKAIELFGTKVAPVVRRRIAEKRAAP
jgi:probable LLM family oxidoreductase